MATSVPQARRRLAATMQGAAKGDPRSVAALVRQSIWKILCEPTEIHPEPDEVTPRARVGTKLELAMRVQVRRALEGDGKACKFLVEYCVGKATSSVDAGRETAHAEMLALVEQWKATEPAKGESKGPSGDPSSPTEP